MNPLHHALGDSVFRAYSVSCVLLCLDLLFLWIASGIARAKSAVAINAEDGTRYHAPVSEKDPPTVARILRAHRNAEAVILPFLLLGLVYVLAGGSLIFAAPIYVIFIAARVAHSALYLAGKQPWRTVAFAISLLATLALSLGDLWFTFRTA